MLQKCDHTHIIRTYEILENKWKFFVVMELVTGGDLMGRISKME